MSQLDTLRAFFLRHTTLTQMEAFTGLGIARLSERVREMESQGWTFLHKRIEVPTRYGKSAYVCQYVLLSKPMKLIEENK